MGTGLVIADAGPIFSLAIIDHLEILTDLFEEVKIPEAVWEEVTRDESVESFPKIESFFRSKVVSIKSFNDLTFIMDYGESESVILYRELDASFLLLDDKKARRIAESLQIKCIGTLGLLTAAKARGVISLLRPLFMKLMENERYYSINLLNSLLEKNNEQGISDPTD